MNTLDATKAFTGKFVDQASVNTNNVNLNATNVVAQRQPSLETVMSPAANEQWVTKVLSESVKRSFTNASPVKNLLETPRIPSADTKKLSQVENTSALTFNSEDVSEHITLFVKQGIARYSKQGADTPQLEALRYAAIIGVEQGIEQALADLSGVDKENFARQLSEVSKRIVNNVMQIDVLASEFDKRLPPDKSLHHYHPSDSAIALKTTVGEQVNIDFDQNAIFDENSNDNTKRYTTSTSTLSFSISGEITSDEITDKTKNDVAQYVNNLDTLIHQFFRGDIENAMQRALNDGYDANELDALINAPGAYQSINAIYAYQTTQHNSNAKSVDAAFEVAKYVENLRSSVITSSQIFSDENAFNELINGMVNQMEDIQIPDLLNAIARFHQFNSQFIA